MAADANRGRGLLAGWIADLERRLGRSLGGWSPRGLLLYALPLPLLPALGVSLLRGDFTQIVGELGALAGCWSAAVLARRGLRAEAVYRHRRIARRPAPRKTLAALLLGAGVTFGAHFAVGHDVPLAGLLGAGSVAGFVLAYGLDPLHRKRLPADLGADTDEVLKTLEEAEERIAGIEAASRQLPRGDLSDRLGRIAGLGRSVVDLLEKDPRDLRRARRFLHVYLSGAQQVTDRYTRALPASTSADLDERFEQVLGTIENVFEEQRRHLLEDEVLDLDVQIEVLARQLEREGAR